jgi:AraC-like DNA-binding protein
LAWIDEAVVSEAKALLSHTDLTVNEIAARVGILDPSYFSRFFRKQVGLTPIDFREKMKKSHQ